MISLDHDVRLKIETIKDKIYGIAFVEVGKRSYNYKRFKRKQV